MKAENVASATLGPAEGTLSREAFVAVIEAVENGVPRLAGVTARLVVLDRMGPETVGALAFCRPSHDGAAVVVLGYATLEAFARAFSQSGTASGRPEPLTLRCGASAIVLHPDGRVRITGEDVAIEAYGKTALRGAVIELN